MVGFQPKACLVAQGELVAPPTQQAYKDQSFELSRRIYLTIASMFIGFIAVLSLSFHGGHMLVKYGVIFGFIAIFFAVPTIFVRVAGKERTQALTWSEFRNRGIVTATGQTSAGDATFLVPLLPCLIMCFGIAIAIIAALS